MRLVRKAYGKRFLRFLPPAKRVFDIAEVASFFREENPEDPPAS